MFKVNLIIIAALLCVLSVNAKVSLVNSEKFKNIKILCSIGNKSYNKWKASLVCYSTSCTLGHK